MIPNKDKAIKILTEENYSCVILKDKQEPICSKAFGIKPLMEQLRVSKNAFKNAIIADRIVGKAAALLAILGGATYVYGSIMSETAIVVFEEQNIPFSYGRKVPFIKNRSGDDRCPMEKTVETISDPTIAFDALEETIRILMQEK